VQVDPSGNVMRGRGYSLWEGDYSLPRNQRKAEWGPKGEDSKLTIGVPALVCALVAPFVSVAKGKAVIEQRPQPETQLCQIAKKEGLG